MIYSMTAFSRQTISSAWGTFVSELRSVNHRFLEINFRVPETLRYLEQPIREQIQRVIARGKLDLNLKFIPGQELPFDLTVNIALLNKLAQASNQIIQKMPSATISVSDILSWQGILEIKQTYEQEMEQAVEVLIAKNLEEMTVVRRREGKTIELFLIERIKLICEQLEIVNDAMPNAMQMQRLRIIKRFEDFKIELDPDRLEQEMVWLVQKMDIAEEVQRIEAHLMEVMRALQEGGVVGRRLDFLMQELNREANTSASKSIDTKVTQAAVEIKVSVEQMREQVQNIE